MEVVCRLDHRNPSSVLESWVNAGVASAWNSTARSPPISSPKSRNALGLTWLPASTSAAQALAATRSHRFDETAIAETPGAKAIDQCRQVLVVGGQRRVVGRGIQGRGERVCRCQINTSASASSAAVLFIASIVALSEIEATAARRGGTEQD